MQSNHSIVILCAGVGRRLGGHAPQPKALLSFAGRTLLERHLEAVQALGVAQVAVVTGFKSESIEAHLAALKPSVPVEILFNPRFREGSVVSMAAAAPALRLGKSVVFMDADVLYDRRMLPRLEQGTAENVLLFDREVEPGDEPVKICLDAEGRIVDFRKRPDRPFVRFGESVGFFRFSPKTAEALADDAEAFAGDKRSALEYEEAIRERILAEPDRFGVVDVSDLPWTEIDFPEDVVRAREEILPRLESL